MQTQDIKETKLRLADGTEIVIEEGASLSRIPMSVSGYDQLDEIEESLKKSGNLYKIQFLSGDDVTGEYEYMTLPSPTFRYAEKMEDGHVDAVTSLNSMDPTQKELLRVKKENEDIKKEMDELRKMVEQLMAGK